MVVGLQSIFPPISPPISFYHFPLLQEFDSKKPSSPFNDLDKFLKPITAISFPLTIRHWKAAFKQDHREQLIENKQEKKLFLQLMGKYTISGTTRLYPRPTFIQDLCS